MSHGRIPRRIRYLPTANVLASVLKHVTALLPHELQAVRGPIDASWESLRAGVATEHEWSVLASAIEVSLAIEDKGVVRGARGHIKAAEAALYCIGQRANSTGAWRATALQIDEIDDISTALELHAYQLEQLSAGEVVQALELATGRVRSDGGRVLDIRSVAGALA